MYIIWDHQEFEFIHQSVIMYGATDGQRIDNGVQLTSLTSSSSTPDLRNAATPLLPFHPLYLDTGVHDIRQYSIRTRSEVELAARCGTFSSRHINPSSHLLTFNKPTVCTAFTGLGKPICLWYLMITECLANPALEFLRRDYENLCHLKSYQRFSWSPPACHQQNMAYTGLLGWCEVV